ncbi:MAG: histidine phosphatase family protein [Bacilli bacterium]|nr:histidine phosphatase family protein [Bacilli bacterium]
MKLYLVSNNLVLENIIYHTDETLEQKRVNRPLSLAGEKLAKKLSESLEGVQAIYSSAYASALASAKYVAAQKNLPIYIDSNLRDAVIGNLGNQNIKQLRFKQEKDFNYRYVNGESLNDTSKRMKNIVNAIVDENRGCDVVIFSHKRAIMGYLLDYADLGYNLDDRLILSYDDKVVIDDADKEINVIEITIEDEKITYIKTWE